MKQIPPHEELRDGFFFARVVSSTELSKKHMEPLQYATVEEKSGLSSSIPRIRLSEIGTVRARRATKSNLKFHFLTEINLGDIDKTTGEVVKATKISRDEIDNGQNKCFLDEDTVIVGKIRPYLGNVAIVQRPEPGFPPSILGSSEWIEIVPREPSLAYYLLLAARSPFFLSQISIMKGQTRPRADVSRITNAFLPDVGLPLMDRIARVLKPLYRTRLLLRTALKELESVYYRFGVGEISSKELSDYVTKIEKYVHKLLPNRATLENLYVEMGFDSKEDVV